MINTNWMTSSCSYSSSSSSPSSNSTTFCRLCMSPSSSSWPIGSKAFYSHCCCMINCAQAHTILEPHTYILVHAYIDIVVSVCWWRRGYRRHRRHRRRCGKRTLVLWLSMLMLAFWLRNWYIHPYNNIGRVKNIIFMHTYICTHVRMHEYVRM